MNNMYKTNLSNKSVNKTGVCTGLPPGRCPMVKTRGLCDQVQMIQKKDWLSHLQSEEIWRLVEKSENNVQFQQVEQNQTDTEPLRQVTEQHNAQNLEDDGRGE